MSAGEFVMPGKTEVTAVKTAQLELYLSKDDKADIARKFLKGAGERVGIIIMQEWLSHPDSYDIDITVTMRSK